MQIHGTRDDLKIQIDSKLENSSFELNNVNNIDTSSNTNVYNISVGTNSVTNKSLDSNDLDECLKNNEKDKDNKASFSLHETQVDCLF